MSKSNQSEYQSEHQSEQAFATVQALATVKKVNQLFLLDHPVQSARQIENMAPKYSLPIFISFEPKILFQVWHNLGLGTKRTLLPLLPKERASLFLSNMDTNACAELFSSFPVSQQEEFIALLSLSEQKEVREYMLFPIDSAGYLMERGITTFHEDITVGGVIADLKRRGAGAFHYLYIHDDKHQLVGQVDMQEIAFSEPQIKLSSIAKRNVISVNIFDSRDDVLSKIQRYKIHTLPVVDANNRLQGLIHENKVVSALEESIVGDIQSMVGVSKEENALSSVWFKISKRQPWLQINLLTAFLAASVVGIFEGIIAEYTALAVLLPVVAGQSGNTGAQALAVTMRGLTLREITTKQWFKIVMKEFATAFFNGVAIATTCAVAVYLWSRSVGLSIIIALSMTISMILAAMAGALIPIILKRLGQDPALSSAILLSTVTDICGFMAFLGIATIFLQII